MAAEEDGDVFEITDFTTASDWESFIARLEEVLHEWKLVNREPLPSVSRGKYTEGPWEEKTEDLMFADYKFLITYTRLKLKEGVGGESRSSREREEVDDDQVEDEHKTPTVLNDIISMENDFPSRAHCLCRWYGLQEFMVIQPAPNFGIIDSESRAKILESSAAIALSNSACHIPVFIQLQQKWRKLYEGIAVVPGANVLFEMSHLKKLPARYIHLEGLLNMFKAKLGCEYISMPPVSVSVRFTYILEDWIHCPWPQLPPDFSSFAEGEVGCSELDVLPFGACEDPVSELHLSCSWPYLSADMIIETSGYSDLDPLQAPQWSVRIQMTEDPQCLLGQYLRAFMDLCTRMETTDEILGHSTLDGLELVEKEGGEDITNALQRLTEPSLPYHIPTLGSVVSRATTRLKIKPEEAPIPQRILNQILLHLFPDATGLNHALRNKRRSSKEKESKETTPLEEAPPTASSERMEEVFSEALKQLKSAPPDSLTYRLAVCLVIINFNHGGLRAIAHLWQEFILEMRYRWENSILIPDLGAGPSSTSKPQKSSSSSSLSSAGAASSPGSGAPAPNLGSCLIHQKLQMLNCCIERKVKREAAGYGHESTVLHEASSSSTMEAGGYNSEECEATNAGGDVTDKAGKKARSMPSSSDDDEEFFECIDMESSEDDEQGGGDRDKYNEEEKEAEQSDSVDASRKRSSKTSIGGRSLASAGKRSLMSDKSMDSNVSDTSYKDAMQIKAEGRLAPLKNMKSLTTNEPLFIPVTQEPSPMTEDMLEEQAEVLAKLGSSAEGSQLRARMQSACLLSDMESFKAANPGCCLEDFVRWYSPRDYIEPDEEVDEGGMGSGLSQEDAGSASPHSQQDSKASIRGGAGVSFDSAVPEGRSAESEKEKTMDVDEKDMDTAAEESASSYDIPFEEQQTLASTSETRRTSSSIDNAFPHQRRGRLSQRMQIPGNMWVEVWQSARPVPARRQKRLFDDTKEAEKVLHFLSGLRPGELVLHLLPIVTHACILKLAEKEDSEVPVLKTLTDQILAKAVKVTRGGAHTSELKRYEEVIRMIELAETVSSRAQSLKTKFTKDLLEKGKAEEELHNFVSSLLQHPEVEVRGGAYGPAGSAIHKLFVAAQKAALMIVDDDDDDSEKKEANGSTSDSATVADPAKSSSAASSVHDFPTPSAREYILRAMVPRPAPFSRVLPQRMYCVMVDGDYRLAGAFSSDTTFQ